jgi:hypothetical protein
LAALLLAGVRNVEPRPSVGFKFHAVLVVQSVHLASLSAAKEDRWLPIFWALDYFKDSQARDERERGWTMAPVNEADVPTKEQAQKAFREAMEGWNEPAADAAIAGLARHANHDDIWELMFRFGARDFRSIGHKAIDVANSHRVLEVIGWQDAEPILRSLAYACLMHEDGNPAERDAAADRPWRRNQELIGRIPAGWESGQRSLEATEELLTALRTEAEDKAVDRAVQLLEGGVGAASLWDALWLGAVELLVRQPGIVALHSVTTTNSLYYAFRHARDEQTRRLVLLQNVAFLPMFQQAMRGRGRVRDFDITALEPEPAPADNSQALEQIFADVQGNPMVAAKKTLAYGKSSDSLDPWVRAAQDLLIDKSTGAHDYKFGYSVLEDVAFVHPELQRRFLAGSVFSLQSSSEPDNPLMARVRAALQQ